MIPQQIPVKNHYGNNSATYFNFDFYAENEKQIIVTHTDLEGKESVLQYGIDYELVTTFPDDPNELASGWNNPNNSTGGAIRFPLESSQYSILAWDEIKKVREILSIALTLPIEQPSEYKDSSNLNLENLEYSFDYLTRLLQILARTLTLTMKVSEGSGEVNLKLPQPIANNVFKWNADATSLENYDLLSDFEAFKTEATDTFQQQQSEFQDTLMNPTTGIIPKFEAKVEDDISGLDARVTTAEANASTALSNTTDIEGNTAINLAATAKEYSDNALTIADSAQKLAANANVTSGEALANTIDEEGNNAITLAKAASVASTSAVTTANNALANTIDEDGNNAIDLAKAASITSTNAASVAGAATTTANNADSKADTAITTATAASTKVDEFGEDIGVVIEAAGKIQQIEGAVEEAKEAAGQATVAADNAVTAADNATQAAADAIAALSSKQDKIEDLESYVKNTDYASTSKAGVIKTSSGVSTYINSSNGILNTTVIQASNYDNLSQYAFIGKGTLENIKERLVTSVGDALYQSIIADLDTIRAGASKGATALQTIPIAKANVVGGVAGGNWLTVNQTTGKMECGELTKAQFDSANGYTFIGKTTLNNVLADYTKSSSFKTVNGESIVGSGNVKITFDELNNPYTLLESKYTELELNNASWLKSNGQWNTKAMYSSVWEKLHQPKYFAWRAGAYNDKYGVIGTTSPNPQENDIVYQLVAGDIDGVYYNVGDVRGYVRDITTAPDSEEIIGIYIHDNTDTLPLIQFLRRNSNYDIFLAKKRTEQYTDYDFVINEDDETFRLPLKTHYLPITENAGVKGNGMTLGMFNGTKDFGARLGGNSNAYLMPDGVIGTDVGNTTSDTSARKAGTIGITTDSSKSGMVVDTDTTGLYLYYYVGETVQNANLIDVGRLSEQLASKEDIDTWVTLDYGQSGLLYNKRNGFCIQWGLLEGSSNAYTGVDVKLLKTYKDINYLVIAKGSYRGTSSGGVSFGSVSAIAGNAIAIDGNTISISFHATAQPYYWQTTGYLAQGEY